MKQSICPLPAFLHICHTLNLDITKFKGFGTQHSDSRCPLTKKKAHPAGHKDASITFLFSKSQTFWKAL